MRRVFWAMVGAGVGAASAIAMMRWTRRQVEKLTPQSVAARLLDQAADWRLRLRDAIEEGRAASREREAELRARYAGPGDGAVT